MPRYIAVHPAAFTEQQLQPLAKAPLPQGVFWLGTYCGFADNTTYCHWVAPTMEAVAEVFQRYEVPYTAIHEVRRFDPATAQLEPAPIESTAAPSV
jgi:hypothetical protein